MVSWFEPRQGGQGAVILDALPRQGGQGAVILDALPRQGGQGAVIWDALPRQGGQGGRSVFIAHFVVDVLIRPVRALGGGG